MIKEGTEARGHRNYSEFGKMKASSGTKKKREFAKFLSFSTSKETQNDKNSTIY